MEDLKVTENLNPDPQGYILKIFMASSQVNSKVFKIHSENTRLYQRLKIKNIFAKELEFWLCTTYNKIIVMLLFMIGYCKFGVSIKEVGRSLFSRFEDAQH